MFFVPKKRNQPSQLGDNQALLRLAKRLNGVPNVSASGLRSVAIYDSVRFFRHSGNSRRQHLLRL